MTTEMPKKRKPKEKDDAQHVQRSPNRTVGETLRDARTDKKIGFDEISAATHIRPAQLRAIEEGNIAALPGMTYALGFVRTYANYLELDGAGIVHKFKLEHGAIPVKAELHFPEPIAESHMPNPVVIGVAAFAAIVLLIVWTIFSGGDDAATDIAEQIPEAPVMTAESSTLSFPVEEQDVLTPSVAEVPPLTEVAVGTVVAVPPVGESVPPVETTSPVAPLVIADTVTPVTPEVKGVPVDVKKEEEKRKEIAALPEKKAEKKAAEKPAEKPEEITVKRGKSRITIQAAQPSWVQVSDAQKKTIFKKVLKTGEQFFVPDEPGMSLITTNAGGIDVIVDGAKVQSLGGAGEIVRGVALRPDELKKVRVKVRGQQR